MIASSLWVSTSIGWMIMPRSHDPLIAKDKEKTNRKVKNLHFGPENSASPNRLLSILTKVHVVTPSMIQTMMLQMAR